jgi:hypothetical protein
MNKIVTLSAILGMSFLLVGCSDSETTKMVKLFEEAATKNVNSLLSKSELVKLEDISVKICPDKSYFNQPFYKNPDFDISEIKKQIEEHKTKYKLYSQAFYYKAKLSFTDKMGRNDGIKYATCNEDVDTDNYATRMDRFSFTCRIRDYDTSEEELCPKDLKKK